MKSCITLWCVNQSNGYHVDSPEDLLYNRCFAYNGLPNVVSSTMSVHRIVESASAILPNVYSTNQPLTKRAFIANLTWRNQPPKACFRLSETLPVRKGETDKVGKPPVRQADIRQTDIVGKPALGNLRRRNDIRRTVIRQIVIFAR